MKISIDGTEEERDMTTVQDSPAVVRVGQRPSAGATAESKEIPDAPPAVRAGAYDEATPEAAGSSTAEPKRGSYEALIRLFQGPGPGQRVVKELAVSRWLSAWTALLSLWKQETCCKSWTASRLAQLLLCPSSRQCYWSRS